MSIAGLIKSRRMEAGLSQKALALRVGLNGSGGTQFISNIEAGKALPSKNKVEYFAKALKCPAYELWLEMYNDELNELKAKYKGKI